MLISEAILLHSQQETHFFLVPITWISESAAPVYAPALVAFLG